MSELRLRPAARAIVIDEKNRALLICFDFGDRLVWAAPGGGIEDENMTAVRWWTLEELEAAGTEFAPRRLPLLVRSLLEDRAPATPVDVGV